MVTLQNKLEKYISNPLDYNSNFELALEYEKLGHGAGALSYFLRCAELCYEIDPDLAYECILKTWLQVHNTKRRPVWEQEQLMTAITFRPERPEAYYLLSAWHTDRKEWKAGYMYASLGCKANYDLPPLKSDVGYKGKQSNTFQKAFSGWWCGQRDESTKLFKKLYADENTSSYFLQSTIDNLIREGVIKTNHSPLTYESKDFNNLNPNIKFKGLKDIKRNYSQCYQDLFVLACLNGKKNGTYLEIGAGHFSYGNNTLLLKELGWNGISIELDEGFVNGWNKERRDSLILKRDALKTNYLELLKKYKYPKQIDYLQLDIDPAGNTYQALLKIPFDEIDFGVITYEHDNYVDGTKSYRELSRKYLQQKGYELVVSNVSPDENSPYEDWYCNPKIVDKNTINQLKTKDSKVTYIKDYILK